MRSTVKAGYFDPFTNRHNKGFQKDTATFKDLRKDIQMNCRTPDTCIDEFLRVKFNFSKRYTAQKCQWSLRRTTRILIANGFDADPRKISKEAVEFLVFEAWKDKCSSYKKVEYSYLKRYMKFYNNSTADYMNIPFPDMRVNVNWLTEEQYDILMAAKKTPLQDIVINLELNMGLRNVECCRLMLDSFHLNGPSMNVEVRGKGRGEGKYRTVPVKASFLPVYDRWMQERARIVQTVRRAYPYWQDPGTLLLWCHYKKFPQAGKYNEHTGSLDDMVLDPLRKQVGFHFCNHDLRRTFGRLHYRAGSTLVSIMKMLGHSSVNETVKYLGLNLDDMSESMDKFEEYNRKRRCHNANN